MDLALYARVLWRFKLLVLCGLLAALVLATLSFAKVTFVNGKPGFKYRKAETWASGSTVLLTQRGFSWGSINATQAAVSGLSGLAGFYSQLISSRAIQERIAPGGRYQGTVYASPVVDRATGYGVALPLINIGAQAPTSKRAISLARRATAVFGSYIAQQQRATHVPMSQRVGLEVVNPALGAYVVTGRKKTVPIAIFVIVMTAAVGLAFVLENLRPSVRVVPHRLVEPPADVPRTSTRSA
jgi:hypothetical protein